MNPTILERDIAILKVARAILTPQGAWTQGAAARRSDGSITTPSSRMAASRSLGGAIHTIEADEVVITAVMSCLAPFVQGDLSDWHNAEERIQEDVLHLLDVAIADMVEQRAQR